ncbi:MAG TPA: hypothetical protein VIZ67_07540, partial [Acidimicrobiales bacterium]
RREVGARCQPEPQGPSGPDGSGSDSPLGYDCRKRRVNPSSAAPPASSAAPRPAIGPIVLPVRGNSPAVVVEVVASAVVEVVASSVVEVVASSVVEVVASSVVEVVDSSTLVLVDSSVELVDG